MVLAAVQPLGLDTYSAWESARKSHMAQPGSPRFPSQAGKATVPQAFSYGLSPAQVQSLP